MPHQHVDTTGITHLLGTQLASQRTRLKGIGTILHAQSDRTLREPSQNTLNMQTDGKHRHIDRGWNDLSTQAFDQLCDAGAGTVHFPVTGNQGATHAVPQDSSGGRC